MPYKFLLDASALLAWLHEETGWEKVEAALDQSAISAVNAAEVIHKLVTKGATPEAARQIMGQTLVPIVEFTAEVAFAMAELSQVPKQHGLSLGDRACLATAIELKATALTADSRWKGLEVGQFSLIR